MRLEGEGPNEELLGDHGEELDGLLDGSLGFGGEESAGASLLV
jgi:hypothetical protein